MEVIEIDGITPVPTHHSPDWESKSADPEQGWHHWQNWQGRIRTLDMRWWPLWVFLGVILVFLLLTVGIVLGILYMIYRIMAGIIAALFRAFRL